MLLPESGVSHSFTRFLLPLTDVMIILFSMFLLMPHLEEKKTPGDVGPGWQVEQQRDAQEQLLRYRQMENLPLSERSLVRTMTIDSNTGDLWVQREPKPVKLTEVNFNNILAEDLRQAQELQKELFYMLLAPLPVGGNRARPSGQDRTRYAKLFQQARQWHPHAKMSYEVVYPTFVE